MDQVVLLKGTKKIATLSKREVRAVFRSDQFCMLTDEQIYQLYLRQEELRRRKLPRLRWRSLPRLRWPFRRVGSIRFGVLYESIGLGIFLGFVPGMWLFLMAYAAFNIQGYWALIPLCLPGVLIAYANYRSH